MVHIIISGVNLLTCSIFFYDEVIKQPNCFQTQVQYTFTFFQEMDDLKAKLEMTEQELEDKWKLFDEQKNSELDRIEFERLKLQELENQER